MATHFYTTWKVYSISSQKCNFQIRVFKRPRTHQLMGSIGFRNKPGNFFIAQFKFGPSCVFFHFNMELRQSLNWSGKKVPVPYFNWSGENVPGTNWNTLNIKRLFIVQIHLCLLIFPAEPELNWFKIPDPLTTLVEIHFFTNNHIFHGYFTLIPYDILSYFSQCSNER